NLEPLDGVTGLDLTVTRQRSDVSDRPDPPVAADAAVPAIGAPAQRIDKTTAAVRTTLAIAGMDCPTEEALIRSKLAGMAGVAALDFNLVQRRLSVTHRPGALEAVLGALKAIGLEAKVESAGTESAAPPIKPAPKTHWW